MLKSLRRSVDLGNKSKTEAGKAMVETEVQENELKNTSRLAALSALSSSLAPNHAGLSEVMTGDTSLSVTL